MTTIIHKTGSGKPDGERLETAEIAIDTSNGNMYTKLSDGSVVHLNDGADDVDLSDYVKEAPVDTKQYARQDAGWSEVVIPDGGTGSSVHIDENPPTGPQEGQQWMEVPADGDATMWIYDGGKWLQQPGGKDGADGQDGVDGGIPDAPSDTKQYARQDGSWSEVSSGLWTDEGSNTISYSGTVLMSQPDAGANALAVGLNAGYVTQGTNAVAVGINAGTTNQSDNATAVGPAAGNDTQGENAVAVGYAAGQTNQGGGATAVGRSAGGTSQGTYSVALGYQAGETNQGTNSIAVGLNAGQTNQAANGIIINSTGTTLNSPVVGHIIIKSSTQEMRSLPAGGFAMNGDPIIGTRGLIKTLSTLRQATMDETQDIRESLRSAIDELVEGFEQEIATMPAGDES